MSNRQNDAGGSWNCISSTKLDDFITLERNVGVGTKAHLQPPPSLSPMPNTKRKSLATNELDINSLFDSGLKSFGSPMTPTISASSQLVTRSATPSRSSTPTIHLKEIKPSPSLKILAIFNEGLPGFEESMRTDSELRFPVDCALYGNSLTSLNVSNFRHLFVKMSQKAQSKMTLASFFPC